MKSVVLRYGGLLAVFLIAAETAKRSFLTQTLAFEIYVGLVALAFLLLGGGVVYAARRSRARPTVRGEELSVLQAVDFSAREAEVLLFLCHGYSNSDIADQLGISANTVKTHLKNIYGKLGVSNRTQAAAEAKMLKIIG